MINCAFNKIILMSKQIKYLNIINEIMEKKKEFQNTDQETITKYRFNYYFLNLKEKETIKKTNEYFSKTILNNVI